MTRVTYQDVEWMVLQFEPVAKNQMPLWTIDLPDDALKEYQRALDEFNEQDDRIRQLINRSHWGQALPQ